MKKELTRALRRHHARRLKAKRQHYQSAQRTCNPERGLGSASKTPAKCSCFMCGNPRKTLGEPTIGERKNLQRERFSEPFGVDDSKAIFLLLEEGVIVEC